MSNPISKNPPVDELKELSKPPMYFIEQGGQIVDDSTGKKVSSSFSESMPIQRLKNGPYEVNQH